MPESVRLVLASASPRRLDLLQQIGIVPDAVVAPNVDEAPFPRELPADHALRLAREKCDAVASRTEAKDALVLAADTVVACGRRILPKAGDEGTARRCLRLLSGRRHRVVGGVALRDTDGRLHTRRVVTQVSFKKLAKVEIEGYLRSGEWDGKAGGYAIQGAAGAFVRWINGSYSNVVGLPLFETAQLLAAFGLGPGAGAVRDD